MAFNVSLSMVGDHVISSSNCVADLSLSKYDREFHEILTCLHHSRVYRALTITNVVSASYFLLAMKTLKYHPKSDSISFKVYPDIDYTIKQSEFCSLLGLAVPSKPYCTTETDIFHMLNQLGHRTLVSKASDFLKPHFPPIWRLVFTLVQRCLTNRSSSMDQGNIRIFTLMYGVVFNGMVDIGGLIWDHMIELIPDINSSRIVNYHRFWCVVIAHAYAVNNLNASEGDGENVMFSNLHTPKFSKSDNDNFVWISRIPTFMLKQVPADNVLIQAYMANPENAYKSRPSTAFESKVIKATKKGGKKGSSSSATDAISPTKKSRRGQKQSDESSDPSPDLLAGIVSKRKRGSNKPTPRIPSPVVEDSEETEEDVPLQTKKRRHISSPPISPHHSSGHEYVLKDLEGIFPDFVESPQPSIATGPAEDFTFVVKKDFNELVKKVDGMHTTILSSRTMSADSFKAT